jgi:FixJ family two-component response regulator
VTRLVHVVDDDLSMRRSLSRLLAGAGFDVTLYGSAEEFLAVADGALSGCLLLDLRLPGASGLELQQLLVARRCRLPIVFLTAHGEVAATVRAMKRGAVDFLEKPVAPAVLIATLSRACARFDRISRAEQDRVALRARAASLTLREREVWLRVAQGQLNKQIAHDLGIVERTVKLHRASAMAKLQVLSAAEMVLAAERLGLL